MQYLALTALVTTAAFASPIAQGGNGYNYATPPAGTIPTPAATPGATPGAGAGLQYCGPHAYSPSAYVCYGNANPAGAQQKYPGASSAVLCPIQNGRPLSVCGQQCYDDRIFSCAGGTLAVGNNGTTPVVATPTPAGVYPPAGATPTGFVVPTPGAAQ